METLQPPQAALWYLARLWRADHEIFCGRCHFDKLNAASNCAVFWTTMPLQHKNRRK
jgi:hypothetical protein